MNQKLKELKDIKAPNCVTIILSTHRTSPSNLKDGLHLKNLVSKAEKRLLETEDKKEVKALIKSMKKLAKSINHSKNLESLILFVSEDITEYIRLPIEVEDRVIVDDNFATRDIVRALHSQADYYVLILNQKEARLIEAFNDKFVREITDGFPMENEHWFRIKKVDPANATRQRNLVSEFFNRVDKALNKVWNKEPLPVLICTDSANYHEYLKIADNKNIFLETSLNHNKLDEKKDILVKKAWDIVEEYIEKRKEERKGELMKSVGSGRFLNDLNEIWQAIQQGRVRTLFIEQGLFQPGILTEEEVILVPEGDREKRDIADDIYDEMIEANMAFGGEVVFLPKGELDEFNGFGAITRY